MINRKHRSIAILLVCVMLLSAVVIPMGHSKGMPGWLLPLWIIFTGLEDILSGIDRIIGLITHDLEEMREARSDANDKLLEWYPQRTRKERTLGDKQAALDTLNAEHKAALAKKRNARARIKTLKREISQIKSSLSRLSPSAPAQRTAWESDLQDKESALAQAKQDVKDADKILNSLWRGIKISWYGAIIGDAFSGLRGELARLRARIHTLETLSDTLDINIKKKDTELGNETRRRGNVQIQVDQARENYKNARAQGDPNTQH